MFNPNRLIPYSRQLIEEEDIRAVVEVLRSDYLTQGPAVGCFEEALASFCGAKFAVVFATGTAALHGAYHAVGLGPGDEIITSPNTFAATSNAALYLGARPVFSDIEPDTGNLDPALIEEKITPATRIIVPVHYSGHSADLDAIHEIARRRGLLVIEDASHALGARYKDRRVGPLSDMTVFSFHPVKPITTGEGGAVLTNNEDYYKKLLIFRTHGISREPSILENRDEGPWYYEMLDLGYNYRITDIQCALGLSQLRRLEDFIARRRAIVARYQEAFREDPRVLIPAEKDYAFSTWHLLPARLKAPCVAQRRRIFEELREKCIWVQVHYIPVYRFPYYRGLGYAPDQCPRAEAFYQSEISLPVFQGMTDDEAQYVIDTLKDVLSRYVQ